MANRAQEVIRALFGCRDSRDSCGTLSKKIANYRGYQSPKCTPTFGTIVNTDNSGVVQYGGSPDGASACCDTGCGGAAGKIPVQNGLENRPSSPVKSAPTKAPQTSTGQTTWLGTAPQTFGGGQLG